MFTKELTQLKTLLDKKENIVITTHFSPDGDAIGSSMGLAQVLKALGKKVTCIVPNKFPKFLAWIGGTDEILVFDDSPKESIAALNTCDLIFLLDFNVLSRLQGLGDELAKINTEKVLIDHHQEPDEFDINFSKTSASSTCELVVQVLEGINLDKHINENGAHALYTGLMTDTGSFRFSSTSAETFRIAGKLVSLGVEVETINRHLNDSNKFDRLRLMGFTLSEKMVWLKEYNTIYFTLSAEELERFNYEQGDTEGLVNFGLSVGGVNLSVFMAEKDGKIKMSFRSKADIPANQIAKHFDGGGHINAAGGVSFDTWDITLDRLHKALEAYKDVL